MHPLVPALLLSMLGGPPSGITQGPAVSAPTRCVRIAFLTDLHGCLTGLEEAGPVVEGVKGAATAAGHAFLLFDGGDTYWIRKRNRRPGDDLQLTASGVARSLEWLGVAASAYGNHDDDGGPRPRTAFPALPSSAESREAGVTTVTASNGLEIRVVGLARYTPLETARAAITAAAAAGDDAVVVIAHSDLGPFELAAAMRPPASLLLVGHHHAPARPVFTKSGVLILRPAPGAGNLQSALLCAGGGEVTVTEPRTDRIPAVGCPEDRRRRRR